MAPMSRLAQVKYGIARSVTGAPSADARPGAFTTVIPPSKVGAASAVSGPS